MSTAPTAKADWVIRKMRMAAARSVSASPIVEMSWADHMRLKSRLPKIANIDLGATAGCVMDGQLPPSPLGDGPRWATGAGGGDGGETIVRGRAGGGFSDGGDNSPPGQPPP